MFLNFQVIFCDRRAVKEAAAAAGNGINTVKKLIYNQ
jgi:hypothetical protein